MCYPLNLYDTYGDGWNGNTFNISDQSFTVEYITYPSYNASYDVCLAYGCYDV